MSEISEKFLGIFTENFRLLDLSYHDGVTNSLLTHLPVNLKFLNIRGCNRIDNEGLRSIHYLHKLEDLSIRACTKITDEGEDRTLYFPCTLLYICTIVQICTIRFDLRFQV